MDSPHVGGGPNFPPGPPMHPCASPESNALVSHCSGLNLFFGVIGLFFYSFSPDNLVNLFNSVTAKEKILFFIGKIFLLTQPHPKKDEDVICVLFIFASFLLLYFQFS